MPLELVYLKLEYTKSIKKQTNETNKNPLNYQARLQRVKDFIVEGKKESAIINYFLEKSTAQKKGEGKIT